jgi:ubiquinone/menaquinone biosynthesis C-methylase UbiE
MINAVEFDEISTNVFYPIYPVIAKQIIEYTGKKDTGYCMDIGSGNGYLGISIAKTTEMKVGLYDISKEILEIADRRIRENGLEHRVETVYGNVEKIDKPDESVDLIVSRGSVFFWENRVKAFEEIYRVLKAGGYAYIGGGFGNKTLKEEIDKKMLERDPDWLENRKERRGSVKIYAEEVNLAGIKTYKINEGEDGLWIIIEKAA